MFTLTNGSFAVFLCGLLWKSFEIPKMFVQYYTLGVCLLHHNNKQTPNLSYTMFNNAERLMQRQIIHSSNAQCAFSTSESYRCTNIFLWLQYSATWVTKATKQLFQNHLRCVRAGCDTKHDLDDNQFRFRHNHTHTHTSRA